MAPWFGRKKNGGALALRYVPAIPRWVAGSFDRHYLHDFPSGGEVSFAAPKYFMLVWTGLALTSMAIWYAASPHWRRKWRPYGVIGFAAFFLLFIYAQQGRKGLAFAAVPIALITFLNLKVVKVCPSCGETSKAMGLFFFRARYCGRCGASFGDRTN